MEILVQHLNKVMYGLQIAEIIVVDVHANAKVETRIASIHNFEITELQKDTQLVSQQNCINIFLLPPQS